MTCETCGGPTKVTEVRTAFDGAIVRRMRECSHGHKTATYEITKTMFNAARFDIKKVIRGRAYNLKIARLREQKIKMLADRLAGMKCKDLAVKYEMSVHMARYYTRIARERLYPGAKKRN